MTNFANVVKNNKYTDLTQTENKAVALKSTGSHLLDFFASAGALRTRESQDILRLYNSAFQEDQLLALKALFYTRNVRGGLGERRTFRIILNWLAQVEPEIVGKNFECISEFGRWDDMYALVGTPLTQKAFDFMKAVLVRDIEAMFKGENVTLLAKWLKSTNTSSEESRKLGKLTARYFGMSEKQYRQILSGLRKHIGIVERKMSNNRWEEIDYEGVPSYAMKTYRKAFGKHDPEGFGEFMGDVQSGEKTIKAGTLYPYDLMRQGGLRSWGLWSNSNFSLDNWDKVLQAQWDALPNYVKGENNVLVMADTSGSMEGLPICTSLGLAIYFAERNRGAYKNLFLTFSESPRFVELQGNTMQDKVSKIEAIVANTNLEKAYDLILEVALKNHVSQDDMPKALIVITDMQFDSAVEDARQLSTFHEKMDKKFSDNGYQMPKVIYWNVDARRETYQVRADAPSVYLVSGQSVSTFKYVTNISAKTPYELMLEVLNDPIYDCVKI